MSPPLPDSAKKDHLDISKPKTGASSPSTTTPEDEEGIIQPFHSFILSFTMILVSEVGDKTFLVAALMAMKHDRMVVFSAAFGALLVMTVLSAVLGHAVPALIPKRLTGLLAAGLFFVFGARLLREGMQMDPNEGVTAEMHEVEQELAQKEKELERRGGGSISGDALEMGLGSRTSRKNRFPSPRSPSESPSRMPSRKSGSLSSFASGVSNLFSLILSPAWVQTFVMTFLGEWGDRSQIATIAMAAGQDYWWVTLGALAGHSICTGVAVIGGRAIAGRVSLKVGKQTLYSFSFGGQISNGLCSNYWRCRCLFAVWPHLPHRGPLRINCCLAPLATLELDANLPNSSFSGRLLVLPNVQAIARHPSYMSWPAKEQKKRYTLPRPLFSFLLDFSSSQHDISKREICV